MIRRRMISVVSYIDQNLISGESVTYKAKLHWILFVKPLLIAALLAGIAGLLFYLAFGGDATWSTILPWIGIGLLVIAFFPLVGAWIASSSAEFAVTNKRVILKVGFIQKKTAEMFLNKIESVGVDQSILGRLV